MSVTQRRRATDLLANEEADKQSSQQPTAQQGRLLEFLLTPAAPTVTSNTRVDGVLIGWLVDIDDDGTPRVIVPQLLPKPRPVVSLAPLSRSQIGAQCAVMFGGGSLASPILMGMLHPNALTPSHTEDLQREDDGETLRIEHAKSISLQCGKASLRLTRDGRIELRGTTLISHSTGLNRVRGASVKLN